MNIKWALLTNADVVADKINPIEGVFIVGRDDSCSLTIKKNEVSRNHAQLEVRSGQLFVKDLGSSNGTVVNGQKITGEVELKLKDSIIFETISFTVGEGRAPDSASSAIGLAGGMTNIVPSVNIPAGGGGAGGDHNATQMQGAVGHNATQMQLSAGTTYLTVIRGKCLSGDMFNLDNMHSVKAGRSDSCDITFSEASVSGEHVLFSLEASGWQVINLSKTNGLFISGNKVIKHILKSGDVIEFGGAVLKFDSDDNSSNADAKIPDWMREQG